MDSVMPVSAYVGLGANLGEPCLTLRSAVAAMAALPGTTVVACSWFYRSAPIAATGPDFINAVAELHTSLPPRLLLEALLAIEQAHGRERPYPNAPRCLDLDLLLWGDVVLNTEQLTLPHPRMHERAFVLYPLLDIAPHMSIPGKGLVSQCLNALQHQLIQRLEQRLS